MQTESAYDMNLQAVIAAISDVLDEVGPIAIDKDTRLWLMDDDDTPSLDLDSLQMLDVVFELEDSMGLSFLGDIEEAQLLTVGDVAAAITDAQLRA